MFYKTSRIVFHFKQTIINKQTNAVDFKHSDYQTKVTWGKKLSFK